MTDNKRKKQAKLLRQFRKIHRTMGAFLFIVFFIISITGLLLGWKKHTNGVILAKTYTGSTTDLKEWLPIDSLHTLACIALQKHAAPGISQEVERIDIRKDKGIVKFVFVDNYVGIQLDGATGEMLHLEQRRADFIEHIHDGSILDRYFGTSDGQIKLIYTSISGVALFTFTVTGFWLWYGPKRMRQSGIKNHT